MKCPCGCPREVPNGRFFATDKCRRLGNKKGIYMPYGGECRSAERAMRRFKKGKK